MNISSNIPKQIVLLRSKMGWTQDQLADRLNVSKQSVSNWERGAKSPRMGMIQKMSDLFNVPMSQLLDAPDLSQQPLQEKVADIMNQLNEDRQRSVYNFATDQLDAQSHPQKIVQFKVPKPIHYSDVTIYGTVSAGTGEFQADEDQREVVRYPGRVPGHDYALRVSGDSMYPMLEDNQVIFVRHSNGSDVHTGQIVIALLNDCAFVKKIDLDEGQVRLISLNPKYKPIEVDEDDDFQIQGTVVL